MEAPWKPLTPSYLNRWPTNQSHRLCLCCLVTTTNIPNTLLFCVIKAWGMNRSHWKWRCVHKRPESIYDATSDLFLWKQGDVCASSSASSAPPQLVLSAYANENLHLLLWAGHRGWAEAALLLASISGQCLLPLGSCLLSVIELDTEFRLVASSCSISATFLPCFLSARTGRLQF